MTFKNTDLIVLLPFHVEFPIYRKFLIDNHQHFGKIICVLTGYFMAATDNQKRYVELLKSTMPFAHFIHACHTTIPADVGIQSHGLMLGLKECRPEADAVLTMEPDVIVENLDAFLKLPNTYDIVTLLWTHQFSPSFLWVKKSVLDKVHQPFLTGTYDDVYYINNIDNSVPLKDRLGKHIGQYLCDPGLKITRDLVQVADSLFCFFDDEMGFYHQTEVLRLIYLYYEIDKDSNRDVLRACLADPNKKWKRYLDKSLACNIPTFEPYMEAYKGLRKIIDN
jgi:hypothetical protein